MTTVATDRAPLLRAEAVVKEFAARGGTFGKNARSIRVLDDVSLEVYDGETVGIVGESGCGKSTLANALLYLDPATSGAISYRGARMDAMSTKERREMRKKLQVVFQDPFESLDPRMTAGRVISEPWEIHKLRMTRAERRERAQALMHRVGLRPEDVDRRPTAFSGGQRQRLGIARALAIEPELIVCDEPIASLDISIQAQILNLLMDIQEESGVAYVVISHDLSALRHIAHRVLVMYLGRVVESGPSETILAEPLHPYTKALLDAVPDFDAALRGDPKVRLTQGERPDFADRPSGCAFRTRCPLATEICEQVVPELDDHGRPGHLAACHHVEQGG